MLQSAKKTIFFSGFFLFFSFLAHPNAITITNISFSYAPGGPLRNGFAARSGTNRQTSGGSYYGVMEMSGNVWERAVTLGTSYGRAFDGTHGDGVLTTATGHEGNATNSGWPGINANTTYGVTDALGCGYRSGSWTWGPSAQSVSDRLNSTGADATRYSDDGCRCVRMSPNSVLN
ncbi:MAG: hypothetical protein PHC58_05465 [Candidatus Omnitrophica bacterium]|nr:hypothetical protein [Candidatus Omnitrophota bacterium]